MTAVTMRLIFRKRLILVWFAGPMIILTGCIGIAETNAPCRPSWLAAAVPSVAVAAVCRGMELEERRGLVPGAAPPVAWVFGPGT